MKYDKAMELVAALRSGKYQQGRNRLKTKDDKYCCLGVACLVAGESFTPDGDCLGIDGILPKKVQEYFDFYDKNGYVRGGPLDPLNGIPLEPLWKKHFALSSVNDDTESSFDQIADLIEKNWQRL